MVARKPLAGTVAANVLAWGTGHSTSTGAGSRRTGEGEQRDSGGRAVVLHREGRSRSSTRSPDRVAGPRTSSSTRRKPRRSTSRAPPTFGGQPWDQAWRARDLQAGRRRAGDDDPDTLQLRRRVPVSSTSPRPTPASDHGPEAESLRLRDDLTPEQVGSRAGASGRGRCAS